MIIGTENRATERDGRTDGHQKEKDKKKEKQVVKKLSDLMEAPKSIRHYLMYRWKDLEPVPS